MACAVCVGMEPDCLGMGTGMVTTIAGFEAGMGRVLRGWCGDGYLGHVRLAGMV